MTIMRINETTEVNVQIFESTQVALNIEFLSMMPASVDLSAFFIELAEEMELTFCEQIDNGCPVLLGLWNNVLKAEKKLEAFLHKWQEEGSSIECKHVPANTHLVATDKVESALPTEAHTCLDSSSAVGSSLIHASDSLDAASSVYSSAVLTSSPHSQLYIVNDEISVEHPPQLVQCTLTHMKPHLPIGIIDQQKENSSSKMNDSNVDIKEIYVDIAVSPSKTMSTKRRVSNNNHSNIKTTEQHPLDKLCRLLCIEEDETVEKRLSEVEKRRRIEEKLSYKYFCDQCSFKTKRENHLLKHAKIHEKIKDILCCDQCDFKTIRESVLCRHKMSHSTIQLVCKLCPYRTHRKTALMKHLRVRHGPSIRKKVKCNFCEYIGVTPRDLRHHLELLHKPDGHPKLWKCSKCPYKSKLRAHLSRHENDVHGSLRQFLCHYCGKCFKRNDTLTQHKIIHGEVNKTFTCQLCGKVCTSSVFFKEHLATHTQERPFLCDVCGSSFKTRGATQRHKRSLHSTHTFPCGQCEMTFHSKAGLNKHRKTHRTKTEATIVPAELSGTNVQGEVIGTPITIQVVYTEQLERNNQDVTIK